MLMNNPPLLPSCGANSRILSNLALFIIAAAAFTARGVDLTLTPLGTYATGVFEEGAAEIVAHDPETQRLFVINAQAATVDVLDISDPAAPTLSFTIDASPYGSVANSVAVRESLVAVAVEAEEKTDPGQAVFFDTDGNFLTSVTVGSLPDMVTFTPNGRQVLIANEGEPNDDYTVDPLGTVSIIDLSGGVANLSQANVAQVDFTAFNDITLPPGLRIFGPGATVAQDLEPEFIAVSHDSRKAWVTLQENNAIATIDIGSGAVTRLTVLGFKNHLLPGNGLDASDRDRAINITNWPVFGMYQPDAIASFRVQGQTYLITANEGDARDYDAFAEETTVARLKLDPTAFPDQTLTNNARLGRLTVTATLGDVDDDGDYDELYTFGGRSFSIWTPDGNLAFDSGEQLEQITAAFFPSNFNANNTSSAFDNRSDNKGPEPEGVVVGRCFGRQFAFIGLERIGGIAVYELTDPYAPRFVTYANNRDFAADPESPGAGDLGPEGLLFIPEEQSPIGEPLLVVGNEISGTTTIFQISRAP
jgi:DNA-binding beta-propeller fold protein YncE